MCWTPASGAWDQSPEPVHTSKASSQSHILRQLSRQSSSLFYHCDKTLTTSNLGTKERFMYQVTVHYWGNSGQLRQESKQQKKMKQESWLAHLPCFYKPGTSAQGVALPHQLAIKKMSQRQAKGQSDWDNPPNQTPSDNPGSWSQLGKAAISMP